MDASTARTYNVRALVRALGGPSAFVAKAQAAGEDWNPNQVSQWISESNPKGIGHRLARRIESAFSLREGQLDRPSGESVASHSDGLDDANLTQAVELLHMLADLRPDDRRFRRISWQAIKVTAKAIARAEGSQKEAVRMILEDLQEV